MNAVPAAVQTAFASVHHTPHVVTIGNFDGVHRGHQYLIEQLRARATTDHAQSLVITFEPHPASVLRPDSPFERLVSAEEKLRLLAAAGVDDVVVIPFTREFAALSADAFLELVTATTQPSAILVGEGFRFGHARTGDGETLARYGASAGFDAIVVSRLHSGAINISTSAIKAALHRAALGEAEAMLGRRYRLRGTVEQGVARGRELGYPTANLRLLDWACVPSDGIYAGYAHVEAMDNPLQAMVYIGTRPTFDNGHRIVEVNILDFSGDLYTRDLTIEFVAWIRNDQAFDDVQSLVQRMALDESETRRLLACSAPEDSPGRTMSGVEE